MRRCETRKASTKPAAYPIHDLGLPRFGKIGYLLKVPRARRLIRSLEPDVVHAHHATSYGLLAAAAGVRPLVVTSHGSDVLRSGQKALMRALLRRVLDSADVVTAPAEHVADGDPGRSGRRPRSSSSSTESRSSGCTPSRDVGAQ